MANVIRYKTSQPTKRGLRRGNVVVGTGEENYGPTSTTGYVNGITPPDGGYVIYTLSGNNDPAIYVANNDNDLPAIARTLGGGILDVLGSKNYLQTRANTWVLGNVPDNKVTDGLIASINSQNKTSFIDNIPTENLFGTTAMSFQDDAGVYTNDIISGTDIIGDYFIKDVNNAPWWSGLRINQNGVSPLYAGVSYVLSFECRSGQTGWSWTYDSNASGGGWSGNDQGRLSNTNLVFDKTGGVTYTSDMVNTWQRVSYRVTMKDASVFTGASAYPHDSFFTNTNNVQIYYRNPQLEIDRTTASSYTSGSRSQNTTVYDLSGEGNNGTLQNGTVFNNGVWELDGVDDRIDIADPGYPSSGTDPFSIDITFMVPTGATWYNQGSGTAIIGRGSYGGSLGIFRNSTEGQVSFWARLNGGNIYDPSATGLARDIYHHVVGTFDGNDTAKIYHNGEYIAQEVNANNAGTFDADQYSIGGNTAFGGNNGGYGGVHIAEVKIYNKALSADEVSRNFYKGNTVTNNLKLHLDAGNLISTQDESAWFDLSGNGYTATKYGSPVLTTLGGAKCWELDSVGDYFDINNSFSGLSACTLEAWIYPAASELISGDRGTIIQGNIYMSWNKSNRRLSSYWYSTDNQGYHEPSLQMDREEWHHLATVWTGTQLLQYINGNLEKTTNTTINGSNGTMSGRIGRESDGRQFAGGLGMIKVYTDALTAEEVANHYNSYKARYGK